jgi:anti-sigma regulatory factor (Ser/Thr protein kinase)
MSTGSRYHDGFFLLRGNKSFPVKDTLDRPVMSNSFATDQHQCFIATRSYLYKYSGKEGLFDHIITLPSRTNVLRLDSGILWLGCINGLWSYQDSRLHYHGHDNALLKSPIEDIYTAEDGTWYLATNGNGVIIKKGKQYFHFTTIDGLPSTSCKRFFSDNEKNVWVETKTGICELKQDRNHGFFVGRKKIYPEFFDESIKQIELIRDKLWIKTGSALLNCSWTDLLKPDVPPKIYLTGFLVNGVSMNSARRNFEHDQNFIRLSYVGLSFQNFGKLKYRYKLKGLEENWNVTENTSLQYPFLSPGNYEFIIKTIDLNGTESPEISLIKFSINKPFWQKAWFIILVGLIVFFCIVIIFYYRLNAFKKKERQKTLFNKQMADIEMKALRAQMNPHFLFNAINSIQNYILKKDAKTAQSYLSKFARLIRNVLESSEYEYITLKEETDHMALYMELEKLRSSNKFDYKISVDGSVNVEHVLIPPLLLQPYVENAILHGLLPLPGNNGILEFSLARKNDEIIITIEDNGIGRKKAAELKQKKELSHHSMGLKVSQERISILNVLHKTHTSWTFEDKYDAGGNAAGTKVTISMPIIFKSS